MTSDDTVPNESISQSPFYNHLHHRGQGYDITDTDSVRHQLTWNLTDSQVTTDKRFHSVISPIAKWLSVSNSQGMFHLFKALKIEVIFYSKKEKNNFIKYSVVCIQIEWR